MFSGGGHAMCLLVLGQDFIAYLCTTLAVETNAAICMWRIATLFQIGTMVAIVVCAFPPTASHFARGCRGQEKWKWKNLDCRRVVKIMAEKVSITIIVLFWSDWLILIGWALNLPCVHKRWKITLQALYWLGDWLAIVLELHMISVLDRHPWNFQGYSTVVCSSSSGGSHLVYTGMGTYDISVCSIME